MPLARPEVIALILLAIAFLVPMAIFIFSMWNFPLWFQAYVAGVPLPVIEIIAMRLRGTDVKAVVKTLIMANHAGAPLSSEEVEEACAQGVDLEKIILAYVRAKKDNMDITFQDLVETDLEGRLAEKLTR